MAGTALHLHPLKFLSFQKRQVYVNGIERGHSSASGELDVNWGYKACIGSFDFDGRYLNGELADFQMLNYAVEDKFQIEDMIKTSCEKQSFKRSAIRRHYS